MVEATLLSPAMTWHSGDICPAVDTTRLARDQPTSQKQMPLSGLNTLKWFHSVGGGIACGCPLVFLMHHSIYCLESSQESIVLVVSCHFPSSPMQPLLARSTSSLVDCTCNCKWHSFSVCSDFDPLISYWWSKKTYEKRLLPNGIFFCFFFTTHPGLWGIWFRSSQYILTYIYNIAPCYRTIILDQTGVKCLVSLQS